MRRALFIFACLISCALLFFPNSGQENANKSLSGAFSDAAHYPLFIFFSLVLFVRFCYPGRGLSWRVFLVFIVSCSFAGLSELYQPLVGRTKSWADFFFGVYGSLIGVFGGYVWRFRPRLGLKLAHGSMFVGFGILVSIPIYQQWQAAKWRAEKFPLIADFEDDVQLRLWAPIKLRGRELAELEVVDTTARDGERALRVRTDSSPWSGVRYAAGKLSWEGYQFFHFSIFNPKNPFRIHIRIDDVGNVVAYEDRFNKSFLLKKGWSDFKIPISAIERAPRERKFYINQIKWIYFFVGEQRADDEFYLDSLRLSKSTPSS